MLQSQECGEVFLPFTSKTAMVTADHFSSARACCCFLTCSALELMPFCAKSASCAESCKLMGKKRNWIKKLILILNHTACSETKAGNSLYNIFCL